MTLRPSIIGSLFIINRRIWIFVGNIAAVWYLVSYISCFSFYLDGMFPVEKYKLLLPWLVKNNMHQTNIYFCDEFLEAVYFQIKHVKKYLKKKFQLVSMSMFHCGCFLGILDSVIKVLVYEKIKRFVNKFESYLYKVSWREKASLLFIFSQVTTQI